MFQFQLAELSLGPGPYGVRKAATEEQKKELLASMIAYPVGAKTGVVMFAGISRDELKNVHTVPTGAKGPYVISGNNR